MDDVASLAMLSIKKITAKAVVVPETKKGNYPLLKYINCWHQLLNSNI